MKCPSCNETLVMSERQGVEIDYCPSCRGVWLDRGELDKIIERSATEQNNYSSSKQSQNHYHQDNDHHKYHKKKNNWLGELFD